VIYGINIIGDVIFVTFMQKQQYTYNIILYAKFILLLLVCSFIILNHILWFHLHRIRSVNILDGAIGIAISSLDGFSFRISINFWILSLHGFLH